MKTNLIITFILLTITSLGWAQEPTQSIRGQVVDAASLQPLTGANVVISPTESFIGTSTDYNGNFRIEQVPIGRVAIAISYLGYESTVMNNIEVTSGKEVILNVALQESLVEMEEVVVEARTEQTAPLNEMAVASARSFSVEETGRYASSLYDPARMAQNYAGVSTTGGTSDLFNEIIVRGNSPRGVLWRLEGIEIPNPNHFGALGNSGGGISMLSSSLLSSSDFYTGAFPAEFGNATSGAFDLNLRKGNDEQHEHALMVGLLGTEVASEGPIGPKGGASYLVNFRYSTLSMLQKIGLNPVGDVLPEYGDLSFNFHLPTQKMGKFSLFGLAGKNRAYFDVVPDSLAWESNDDMYGFNEYQTVGTVGLSHKLLLSDKSYLHTVAAYSIDNANSDEYYLEAWSAYRRVKDFETEFNNRIYRLSSTYHHKLSAQHTLETGMIGSYHTYDFYARNYFNAGESIETFLQDTGQSTQLQGFIQWKHRVTENWSMVYGIHATHFSLTGNSSIEPRWSSRWNISNRQSIHLALGIHSKPEHPVFYYTESGEGPQRTQPNRNLDYIKSFHAVAGFDHKLNAFLSLRAEAYYQYLYDVPVDARPGKLASMINVLDIWEVLGAGEAINEGAGRNMGIDITLEKAFERQYYFLMTGSIFDSRFRANDNKWYNTRFNSRYQLNLLGGKEFILGNAQNRILGINGKLVANGGNRITPIDLQASITNNEAVYRTEDYLGRSVGTYYRLDVGVSYKVNRQNLTHTWRLDIQNVSNHLNPLNQYYSRNLQAISTEYHTGLFPVLNYRLEF